MRIGIITDSNSGITQSQAKELGIPVITEADFLKMTEQERE